MSKDTYTDTELLDFLEEKLAETGFGVNFSYDVLGLQMFSSKDMNAKPDVRSAILELMKQFNSYLEIQKEYLVYFLKETLTETENRKMEFVSILAQDEEDLYKKAKEDYNMDKKDIIKIVKFL